MIVYSCLEYAILHALHFLWYQAVFLQRVEVLSRTTKSKKIEIKGGFYSEEDMKSELGYSPNTGSNEVTHAWVRKQISNIISII